MPTIYEMPGEEERYDDDDYHDNEDDYFFDDDVFFEHTFSYQVDIHNDSQNDNKICSKFVNYSDHMVEMDQSSETDQTSMTLVVNAPDSSPNKEDEPDTVDTSHITTITGTIERDIISETNCTWEISYELSISLVNIYMCIILQDRLFPVCVTVWPPEDCCWN